MILTHLYFFFFSGAAPAVNPATAIEGAGSGRKRSKEELKKLRASEIRRILDVLGELPETAAQVARIKAEHTVAKAVKRQGRPILLPVLDIQEIARDLQTLQWVIDAYDAHQDRLRLEQQLSARFLMEMEEEDAFLLLM